MVLSSTDPKVCKVHVVTTKQYYTKYQTPMRTNQHHFDTHVDTLLMTLIILL